MTAEFIIPYPSTKAGKNAWSRNYGLNAYYAGKHWTQRKKDAEYWHTLVYRAIHDQCVKNTIFDKPVIITGFFCSRLDIDNNAAIMKMCIDGMKGHLIIDDSTRYVKGVEMYQHDKNCICIKVRET